MRNFIVTGTDTEVGKTYVSCLIVKSLREAGINAPGSSPWPAETGRMPAFCVKPGQRG